jgi:hypothetical protein
MQYKYVGDHAVDVPELSLVHVQPGDIVDVPAEINHGDFVPVKAAKAKASEEDK